MIQTNTFLTRGHNLGTVQTPEKGLINLYPEEPNTRVNRISTYQTGMCFIIQKCPELHQGVEVLQTPRKEAKTHPWIDQPLALSLSTAEGLPHDLEKAQ